MIIKIGESIEHGGQKFVVVDIKHNATMDGTVLYLTAFDPAMADKEQQKGIKIEQTQTSVIDLIKKIAEQGGGNLGFNIGGV